MAKRNPFRKERPTVAVVPLVDDDAFQWRIVQAIAQAAGRTRTALFYTFNTREEAERFADAVTRRLGATVQTDVQS